VWADFRSEGVESDFEEGEEGGGVRGGGSSEIKFQISRALRKFLV
jgi:hypothetical protein